jgi:hypothetical protein
VFGQGRKALVCRSATGRPATAEHYKEFGISRIADTIFKRYQVCDVEVLTDRRLRPYRHAH